MCQGGWRRPRRDPAAPRGPPPREPDGIVQNTTAFAERTDRGPSPAHDNCTHRRFMQVPLQITFRHLAHSDALATHIQRRAEKLEHLFDRMISCHVVVELAGHHHHHGDQYRVSINVGLPGRELVVGHTPADERDRNAHATADRAFDEAARQLEDWVQRRGAHRLEG
jgi:ribosomal subunit interface protein